jgi:hypothetical protein
MIKAQEELVWKKTVRTVTVEVECVTTEFKLTEDEVCDIIAAHILETYRLNTATHDIKVDLLDLENSGDAALVSIARGPK